MTLEYTVEAVQKLQDQVAGAVLTPNDPDYEQKRRGWNLAIDQHPALILIPANVQDVAAGVRFAREQGLAVAVQSTGHGLKAPADDSLLIITSRLSAVHVDAEARTARVEAGVLWKQVLEQSTPHGLAPLLGSSPHVGVVGYTLGGGIGWLARRYGLAADSVRSIDVVTADGVLRRASAEENRDLFWGLRGGGGNFGVVTALELNLYPVATIYGGSLVYPGELAAEALRFYRDWVKTVPDELTSSIAILKFPSLPQMPEAIRGKTQVIVRAAYAGTAAEGAKWIQPWLDWHTPISSTFADMPFSDIGLISNDPTEPTAGYGSNELLDELSDDAINLIIRYATDPASPVVLNEFRHAGGAIARVAPDANAIGNREAVFYMQMGGPVFAPPQRAAMEAYIQRYKAALRPYLRSGVYLNFIGSSHEVEQRIRDAYRPEAYQRLLALKAKYDPDNIFRFSYHLTPGLADGLNQ